METSLCFFDRILATRRPRRDFIDIDGVNQARIARKARISAVFPPHTDEKGRILIRPSPIVRFGGVSP
jgi:hypothetical protein